MSAAGRQTDAEKAVAALIDADTLLFGIAATPAVSGRVSVSSLSPIINALHENLPSLRRVVEEHDAEKAEVADAAYGQGYAAGKAAASIEED